MGKVTGLAHIGVMVRIWRFPGSSTWKSWALKRNAATTWAAR